jgi:putative SOS response-associated peptidase YedK
MCSNYRPVTRMDRLLTFFGVERAKDEESADVFPLGTAPFIRLAHAGQQIGQPALVAEDGMFGLLPNFATEVQFGRRTYNARSETVDKLASFRQAWSAGQRCIIPAEAFYEPCYESGTSVRWRIGQIGEVPMGIAGLYRRWRNPAGSEFFTFTMLTVNADQHPLMKRMHKPGEEKRMVVILSRDDYLPWLSCRLNEASLYFKPWLGALVGEPAPLVRAPKAAIEPPSRDEILPPKPARLPTRKTPSPPPPQGDLF